MTAVAARWWDTAEGRERLEVERQAMQERYPYFVLRQDGDLLGWDGNLTTPKGNSYRVLIQYPAGFPHTPPDVYPIDPPIEAVKPDGSYLKHQYSTGRMCLHYPNDRTFGTQTTAVTAVTSAAAWLFAYEYWLDSGKRVWPGAEAD